MAKHCRDALSIGSLFSGYLGLDLGVRSVFPGAREAWVSDIDKGANKILAHRAPDVPNLGDITRVDWAAVEPVDIITGGSPCQDLSHAGRRAGMTEGTRSNLWVAMREAIATIRPRLVVWENVAGALSAIAASEEDHAPARNMEPGSGRVGGGPGRPNLRALGRVLGDLADLGFDAEVYGLAASDLGACHRRFRIFVMAWPADSDLTGLQGLAGTEGASPSRRHRHPVAGAGGPDLTLLPTPAAANPNDGESVETWEARRQRTKERVGNGNGFGTPLSIAVQLLPTPVADNSRGLPSTGTGFQSLPNEVIHRWGEYAAAIASHERALGRPAPAPTEPGPQGKPRLSARFVEWMMMLPDGWVTDVPGITRNEALKALGNGVVPIQAAHALRLMLNRARAAA